MSEPTPNPFALLDEPHRPWLDSERLKQKFVERSASVHPDRAHNSPAAERQTAERDFSEINAAYQALREPRSRLRHLLELERGAPLPDVQFPPSDLTETAFEIGRLCRDTDSFLAESARITAPLMKVQRFEQAQAFTAKMLDLQSSINAGREGLFNELQTLNSAWEPVASTMSGVELPWARIEQIYRRLGYFDRWSQQLQERIIQLSQ